MKTETETAITREWISFLSKKDRALFGRAYARAEAIVAEHGATEIEIKKNYVILLAMHRIVVELIAAPPGVIDGWGRREPGDDAILAKFADWCTTEDAYSAAVLTDTDLGDQADEITTEILRLPATGAVGLAVKMYLVLYDDCALSCPEGAPAGAGTLVRDLIRFAPILEPRCRAFLDALDAEIST
jgi:hypothetical protein